MGLIWFGGFLSGVSFANCLWLYWNAKRLAEAGRNLRELEVRHQQEKLALMEVERVLVELEERSTRPSAYSQLCEPDHSVITN